MTVSAVDSGLSFASLRSDGAAARDQSTATDDFAVGQIVEVSVVDQSGPGRYEVRINGQLHAADSSSALQRGSTVLAVVTAVGDRLDLRAVSPLEDPTLAQALSALAARYRTSLSAAAQRQIVLAASASDAALATLRAGLYLKKLGQDVTATALAALAAAQHVSAPLDAAARAPGTFIMPTADAGPGVATTTLAQLLERVVAPQDSAGAGAGSFGFADSDPGSRQGRHDRGEAAAAAAAAGSPQALKQELLSLSDGGALQYRYATVPLLVGGRLMELDMALFQQRSPMPAMGAPRRLVMSLRTSNLGAVRIVAQSLGANLKVSLASDDQRGVALLSAAMSPMRERLAALGWQVDAVRCELASDIASAGRDIVDHVLSSGSLDRAV